MNRYILRYLQPIVDALSALPILSTPVTHETVLLEDGSESTIAIPFKLITADYRAESGAMRRAVPPRPTGDFVGLYVSATRQTAPVGRLVLPMTAGRYRRYLRRVEALAS